MAAARVKSGQVGTTVVIPEMDGWYATEEVTNRHASNVIWARFGADPAVAGDNAEPILPGQTRTIRNTVNKLAPSAGTNIRLIASATTTDYTVKGV